MTTNSFVEIDIPQATEFADLSGMLLDFEAARYFAVQLKNILGEENPEYSLWEPMTTAILVRYSRPFAKGRRKRLGEDDLCTLSLVQREAHDRFRSWRDKHIAHSVNVFEDNQPVARYWVERFEDEGFTSIECNSHQLVGLSSSDIDQVIDLTTHFIENLTPRIKVEQNKVLTIIRSMPKEDVLAMKKPLHVPRVEDAGKERRQ